MTRARALTLIAAILTASIIATPTVEAQPAPAYVAVDHTDCGQSRTYAHRVCYDSSSGWFHIYTTAPFQQPNLSFPSNTGYGGSGVYQGKFGIFNTSSGCGDEARWNGGLYITLRINRGQCRTDIVGHIVNGPFYDGYQIIGIYGDNFRFVTWYLAVPGFDFVITH